LEPWFLSRLETRPQLKQTFKEFLENLKYAPDAPPKDRFIKRFMKAEINELTGADLEDLSKGLSASTFRRLQDRLTSIGEAGKSTGDRRYYLKKGELPKTRINNSDLDEFFDFEKNLAFDLGNGIEDFKRAISELHKVNDIKAVQVFRSLRKRAQGGTKILENDPEWIFVKQRASYLQARSLGEGGRGFWAGPLAERFILKATDSNETYFKRIQEAFNLDRPPVDFPVDNVDDFVQYLRTNKDIAANFRELLKNIDSINRLPGYGIDPADITELLDEFIRTAKAGTRIDVNELFLKKYPNIAEDMFSKSMFETPFIETFQSRRSYGNLDEAKVIWSDSTQSLKPVLNSLTMGEGDFASKMLNGIMKSKDPRIMAFREGLSKKQLWEKIRTVYRSIRSERYQESVKMVNAMNRSDRFDGDDLLRVLHQNKAYVSVKIRNIMAKVHKDWVPEQVAKSSMNRVYKEIGMDELPNIQKSIKFAIPGSPEYSKSIYRIVAESEILSKEFERLANIVDMLPSSFDGSAKSKFFEDLFEIARSGNPEAAIQKLENAKNASVGEHFLDEYKEVLGGALADAWKKPKSDIMAQWDAGGLKELGIYGLDNQFLYRKADIKRLLDKLLVKKGDSHLAEVLSRVHFEGDVKHLAENLHSGIATESKEVWDFAKRVIDEGDLKPDDFEKLAYKSGMITVSELFDSPKSITEIIEGSDDIINLVSLNTTKSKNEAVKALVDPISKEVDSILDVLFKKDKSNIDTKELARRMAKLSIETDEDALDIFRRLMTEVKYNLSETPLTKEAVIQEFRKILTIRSNYDNLLDGSWKGKLDEKTRVGIKSIFDETEYIRRRTEIQENSMYDRFENPGGNSPMDDFLDSDQIRDQYGPQEPTD
jgi:hypothetical protein